METEREMMWKTKWMNRNVNIITDKIEDESKEGTGKRYNQGGRER